MTEIDPLRVALDALADEWDDGHPQGDKPYADRLRALLEAHPEPWGAPAVTEGDDFDKYAHIYAEPEVVRLSRIITPGAGPNTIARAVLAAGYSRAVPAPVEHRPDIRDFADGNFGAGCSCSWMDPLCWSERSGAEAAFEQHRAEATAPTEPTRSGHEPD